MADGGKGGRIRPSRPGDEPGLKALWRTVFGDPDSYIDAFFTDLYLPGRAVVAEEDDLIASAIYLLPAGTVSGGASASVPCSYSYALATLPAYRGRGLGGRVTRAAIAQSHAAGYAVNFICPASPPLFTYYEKLGYHTRLSIRERTILRESLGEAPGNISFQPLDVSAYADLREALMPAPGVAFSPDYLRHQANLSYASGGGLFSLSLPEGRGAAAIELGPEDIVVKELLLPEAALSKAAAAIAARFPGRRLHLRMPGGKSGGENRPFALAACAPGHAADLSTGYFALAFD